MTPAKNSMKKISDTKPRSLESFSDSELSEAVYEVRRQAARTNLFYLTREVLGYKELTESVHLPLCAIVQSINPLVLAKGAEKGKLRFTIPNLGTVIPSSITKHTTFRDDAKTRLWLLFRGSFKTTIISIAHTIQLILNNPDIRILITSHKKEGGSQEVLASIKHHFIRNQVFRGLFPEFCPKANPQGIIEWGTQDKVVVPNRSELAAYPEATIETAGFSTDVTGRHYDVIKADDLVTKDSVTNETMLQKTEEYNSLLKFLFDQPEWGLLDYVGTCYHFADLYSILRQREDITKVIIPATIDGAPTIPERFTIEGLEAIKNSPGMGSYVYSCQYDLNPVPEEDQVFRPEWWNRPGFYYDEADAPVNLRSYIFVDPANRTKKKSDYTAIFVIAIDDKGHYWVREMLRDKLQSVDHRVDAVILAAQRHSVSKIFYESVGFQSTDAFTLRKEMQARAIWIAVEEVKSQGANKHDIIRGCQPLFESGLIHFPRTCTYYSQYEQKSLDMLKAFNMEAWMFPKCEHDDMLDCLSMVTRVQLFAPPKSIVDRHDNEFERARQLSIDNKYPKKFFAFGKRRTLHGIPFKQGW